MSVLGNVIGIMLAGRGMSSDAAPLLNRLLSGIAAVVVLSILSAILGGVLLLGALYGVYSALVMHGLEQGAAMMVMGAVIAVILAMMVLKLCSYIHKIKHIPSQVLGRQNPLAERATRVGSAFLDGFMNQSPEPRR